MFTAIREYFRTRLRHLGAPGRMLAIFLVHVGHVGTGLAIAALFGRWFGGETIAGITVSAVEAGVVGLVLWIITIEGIIDGAIRKLLRKAPLKAFSDHLWDAYQLTGGAVFWMLSGTDQFLWLGAWAIPYFHFSKLMRG